VVRNDRGGVVMASQGEPLVGMRSRHLEERDACAVVATIRSSGESTHGNPKTHFGSTRQDGTPFR